MSSRFQRFPGRGVATQQFLRWLLWKGGLLGLVLLCVSCQRGERTPSPKEIEWLTQCMHALPDKGASLLKPVPSPDHSASSKNRYELYMDVSGSMRPYLVETSEAKSKFRVLLRQLGQIEPSRIACFAFGVPRRNGAPPSSPTRPRSAALEATPVEMQPPPSSTDLRALRDETTYVRLANDYVPLIDGFKPPANGADEVQRLVVSDGVESPLDSGQGSFMGGTAGKINHWIDQGGVFALFVFRSPYHCDARRGVFYYSEMRREQGMRGEGVRLVYNTEQRPFMLFAFLSSPAALERLKSEFKDVLSESESWSLEIQPATVIKPLEITPEEPAVPAPGRPLSAFLDTHYHLPGGLLVPGFILRPGGSTDGRIPLRYKVRVAPAADSVLGETDKRRLVSGEGDAVAWSMLDGTLQDNPVGRWHAQDLTPEKDYAVAPPDKAGSSEWTFFAPERGKSTRKRCWDLSLTPNLPGLTYDTDVAAYATRDDSDARAQDRILNFQSLVDEVCRGRTRSFYAPSGGFVVTD